MKEILLRLKDKYKKENWLRMVEQAKSRGKLTEEEYKEMVNA